MAEKEEKYVVIKCKELEEYIQGSEFDPFPTRGSILPSQKERMRENLKSFYEMLETFDNQNKYIVCNQDEPYAEDVWQLILKGEDEKGNQGASQ